MRVAGILILYGVPALAMLLAVPLALGIVPPNHFYGFRSAKAFSSQEMWYLLNRWTGLGLLAASTLALCANLILVRLLSGWRFEMVIATCAILNQIIVLLALLFVIWYAERM